MYLEPGGALAEFFLVHGLYRYLSLGELTLTSFSLNNFLSLIFFAVYVTVGFDTYVASALFFSLLFCYIPFVYGISYLTIVMVALDVSPSGVVNVTSVTPSVMGYRAPPKSSIVNISGFSMS